MARADEHPLDVVVEGPRREDRGTAVTVVDAPKIERLGATTVATALERLPAFNGGSDMRGERILTLRGFDQRQIAVFVDGIPVSIPYDGQLDLNKIPVDTVARVAIVKGASSMLYGPNGLGGAIHVATREPTDRLSLRTFAETSPFLSARAGLAASLRVGKVGAMVGVGFEDVRYMPLSGRFSPLANEDGGRRENSDRRSGNLIAKVVWDATDEQRFTLSLSRFQGVFGVPPAARDFTVRNWRWTDWSATTLGLGHAYRSGRLQTEVLGYVSLFANTLDAYDDGRYLTQDKPKAFHSIYEDSAAGGFVRTAYTLLLGEARSLVLRTWSGLKRDHHAGQADRGADTLRASTNLLTTSAQAEAVVVPRWLRATAGIQLDGEIPDSASSGPSPRPATGWGPQGALTFTPGRAWSFTATVAARTRFPTLRERFSTVFGARAPNPLLRPEHAVNLSFDAVWRPLRTLRVAASVFDAELTDLITSVIIAPQTDQMQNASRARLLGGEAEIQWTFAPWVDVMAGWMILHARSGDALDQQVAYRPDNKGLVMITVTPITGLSVTGVMRHVGGQDFQNPDTGLWGHLGPYQLFDARVEWAFLPALRAWVRATNLADANVEARYSFPEPGRQVFVGLGSSVGP
jgi:iron complex outermembrane recepter protein